MAKKKSNINKYTNGLGINEIYSKISRGSSFIPGVIDESKLTSRIVKKDETFKAKPFAKSYKKIRPVLSAGFSSRGNFRTNYTPPPPFDTDALAYFTAVENAGGTLTDNVKAEFDAFVVREKDAGRWSKLKRLYPFLGGVIDSAIIDAVTLNSATNNNFVDADADTTIGLTGDGSTKMLLTDETADNIYTSAYNTQEGLFFIDTLSTVGYLSGYSDGTYINYFREYNLNNVRWYNPTLANYAANLNTNDANYWYSYSRTSSSNAIMYVNGVAGSTNTTTITAVLPNVSAGIFGRNANGALIPAIPNKLGCSYYAENLTESEQLAFESSYKTFINNIQAYAAAQAYFTAVEAAGGTLTTNVKSEFSAFVSREVEANRWSKIKRLYPYLGGVINSAVIDAVTLNAATNTNFVDGDVDATIGLQGDGSTKYLVVDTTINTLCGDYTWSIGAFRKGALEQSGVTSRQMGYIRTSGNIGAVWLQKQSDHRFIVYGNTTAISTYSAVYSGNNHSQIGGRISNTELFSKVDGVTVNTVTTTDTTPLRAENFLLFAVNSNGTAATHSSINSTGMFIADGMSQAELTSFESSYKTFINNITA